MYGFERLRAIVEKTLGSEVKTTVTEILHDQKKFCGENTSPEDDITLLVIDF